MKHDIDVNYFPGWVRKSMTFAIDDGRIEYDAKFLEIVRPYGFLGTFYLSWIDEATAPAYVELYRGMRVANHEYRHVYPFDADRRARLCDEIFPGKETADPTRVYKTDDPELYMVHTYAWCRVVDDETYIAYAKKTNEALRKYFGDSATVSFAWPNGQQDNPKVFAELKKLFKNIRAAGQRLDEDGFNMPKDRNCWTYTARPDFLLSCAEAYEAYPDDGELKVFCFGLHSVDYRKYWDALEEFAKRYGNRPEDFYYAPMNDLFEYEDAVRAVVIDGEGVYNPSDIDLYIKVDGARIFLSAKSRYNFNNQ